MAFSKLTLIMMRNMLVLRSVAALPLVAQKGVRTCFLRTSWQMEGEPSSLVWTCTVRGSVLFQVFWDSADASTVETGWLIPDVGGLYVHVHGPHLAGLVLLHPQLPVFGWVHVLQQLVHRLHHLETIHTPNNHLLCTFFLLWPQQVNQGADRKSTKTFTWISTDGSIRTLQNFSSFLVWNLTHPSCQAPISSVFRRF